MLEQAAIIRKQIETLQDELNKLYCTENGQIVVRPGVTKSQLKCALENVKKIYWAYSNIKDELENFNVELREHRAHVEKTKNKISSFEKDFGVRFPTFIRELYNM